MSATESKSQDSGAAPERVVFFDGVCGLCSRTVDFLIARDNLRRLHYAPLQGKTAQQLVPADLREKLNTFVFLKDGQLFIRTAALVQVLYELGPQWKACSWLLWCIPAVIRDSGYRVVSRLRYRLFGKHESCRLPTAEERNLFLP